jgi:hypothetical protein
MWSEEAAQAKGIVKAVKVSVTLFWSSGRFPFTAVSRLSMWPSAIRSVM